MGASQRIDVRSTGRPRLTRPDRRLIAFTSIVAAAMSCWGAHAATVDRPSPGYIYFHKPGADMALHDAAVETCVVQARGIAQPQIFRAPAGPLTAMALKGARDSRQRGADRTAFDANLENCMVAAGWDVVRVSDNEGQQLALLPTRHLSEALAGWVGAAQVHGEVVRRYEAADALVWKGGVDESPGPPSLSLSAGQHDLGRLNTPPLKPPPSQWRKIPPHDARALKGGEGLIVVSVSAQASPERRWTLVRLEDASDRAAALPALDYVTVAEDGWKAALSADRKTATYAIPAPAGRWRLAMFGSLSFCLGAPSFDLAAGEVIDAGYLASDRPTLPAVAAETNGAALSALGVTGAAKPAIWTDGGAFPCGALRPAAIYTLKAAN